MEKIETTGIAITQQRTTIIAALQIITTHRRHLRTIDQAKSARHPRHKSKLKKIADEVDREEELKQKKKKNSALKEAANEVAREEAGGRNSSRSKKNKSSLKDIAAAISSDEDDYNDDDFEGNDTGIAKPSKPSRPSGAASRPVGGARPTAKKPSTASRPQGRPKGRPSGASRPTRPSRNT